MRKEKPMPDPEPPSSTSRSSLVATEIGDIDAADFRIHGGG